MFAVDENIGGAVDKATQSASNSGRLTLIFILLFVGVMALFLVIMFFARRRFLPKSERKAKVLRLP